MIKKLLLALLGIIVLLAVCFLAIGWLNPSLAMETRVEINKPRSVVWKYFVGQNNLKEWLPNVKSIENIRGEPMTAGSKFKMTFEENGSEIVMTETMTEVKENEVFAFVLENEVIRADERITFIDKGDKTELVENSTLVGGNIVWRALFALSKFSFQANSAAAYQKLKTNVENLK